MQKPILRITDTPKRQIRRLFTGILMMLIGCFSTTGSYAETQPVSNSVSNSVNNESALANLENLKKKALQLNREIFILEEDLLFPVNTQVSVFLSVDVGEFFKLDAVELTLDGKTVASHLYTERQVNALHRGGMQRLYVGNVKTGEHEITGVFTGLGPKDRPYKRAASLKFKKTDETKMIELVIQDSTLKYQPEFSAKEWE